MIIKLVNINKRNIMNTIKEKFEAIKKVVFDAMQPEAPAPAPQPEEAKLEMTSYKLADGTEVMIDKLEVGGVVKVGETVAPDATHTLEDGTMLTTVAGVITEVKTKEAEPVAEPVPSEEMAAFKAELDEVKVKLAAQTEATSKLIELIEFMINEPKVQPAQKAKSFEEMTPLERFRAAKQNLKYNN